MNITMNIRVAESKLWSQYGRVFGGVKVRPILKFCWI